MIMVLAMGLARTGTETQARTRTRASVGVGVGKQPSSSSSSSPPAMASTRIFFRAESNRIFNNMFGPAKATIFRAHSGWASNSFTARFKPSNPWTVRYNASGRCKHTGTSSARDSSLRWGCGARLATGTYSGTRALGARLSDADSRVWYV